jgi:ATP-dependent Clp endopeptidase proteolytic subunit ClpP
MSYKNFMEVYTATDKKRADWFKISAKVEGETHIAFLEIFDVITPSGGNDLIAQLKSMKADEIRLFINSPGGDVFTGFNVYNALKSVPAKVTTFVTGLAASAASIIALAGQEVVIYENSFLMCHQAWGFAIGNADEMLSTVSILEKLDNAIVDIYASKTKKDKAEILTMMKAETWFNSAEASEYGLADVVLKDAEAKGTMAFDLSIYANAPDVLLNITNTELMNKVKADLELDAMEKKRKQMLKRLALTEIEL